MAADSQEDPAVVVVTVEVESPLEEVVQVGSYNCDFPHLSSGFNKVLPILKQSYCDLI